MPVVRRVRDAIAVGAAPTRSRRIGMTVSLVSPRISRGTPGSITTQRPCSSSSQSAGRGAVPVLEHARTLGHHRLHDVVSPAFFADAEAPEARRDLLDDRIVAHELAPEELRDRGPSCDRRRWDRGRRS